MSSQEESKDQPYNNNNNNKGKKPDHGETFVPGSEQAPDNLAPKPLDHFKRGYQERANLRDREFGQLNADFDHYDPSFSRMDVPSDKTTYRRNEYRGGGGGGGGGGGYGGSGYGGRRDQTSTARHLEVAKLVDRLSRPGCNLDEELDYALEHIFTGGERGKTMTAILSNLARRRKIGVAFAVWQWMDRAGIEKNVYHYNSLISVFEKTKDSQKALNLLKEMERAGVKKNEVTFSSAISACEKCGQWRSALNLLDQMKKEGVGRTAIAYNAAISACEKGLVPNKALEIFEQMKKEGVTPTVITFSALISACEKGQQWKLALEVLEEMKAAGHGANVIAYSACISALSKGQQWEKALDLFRDIERSGGTPSVVTYNATMTALEKGLQWERALDLFDEMKLRKLAVTVVSYGSAIAACEKGFQWRQCLEYLDEMTEVGIKKNVIIFGAAMSCMEKCCRADIAFQLMDRMKIEGVSPNVHIYNSAISACARCDLWEQGWELFKEMGRVGVVPDVVSYNAVLDAVSSQVELARGLFKDGVERGFYARVSRLGTQWLELDLHFLSLGGGETALVWWFEECLVPYLVNSSKLEAVQAIDIVTGYGKTRMRGIRHGDDGMRKRVRAMLKFMSIHEVEQPNKGRVHINKAALEEEVKRNNGKIIFDLEGYRKFKMEESSTNAPEVQQKVRQKITPIADTRFVDRGRSARDRNRNNYQGRGYDGNQARGYDRNRDGYQGGGYNRSNDRDNYQGGGYDRGRERDNYQGGGYDPNRERDSQYRSDPPRNNDHDVRPSANSYDDRRRPRSPPREQDRYASHEAARSSQDLVPTGGGSYDDPRRPPRSSPRETDRYHSQSHEEFHNREDTRNYDHRREPVDNTSYGRREADRDYGRRQDETPRYGEEGGRHVDNRASYHDRQQHGHGGDRRSYHRSRSPEAPESRHTHGGNYARHGGAAGRFEDDRMDYRQNTNVDNARRNDTGGYNNRGRHNAEQYGDNQRRAPRDDYRHQQRDRENSGQGYDNSRAQDQFERPQPKRGYDLDAIARRLP